MVYLDHAGTALPPQDLLRDVFAELMAFSFGNPHSSTTSKTAVSHFREGSGYGHENTCVGNVYDGIGRSIRTPADQSAYTCIESREAVLRHFGVTSRDYELVFTSGTTSGLKIVAEHFPWTDAVHGIGEPVNTRARCRLSCFNQPNVSGDRAERWCHGCCKDENGGTVMYPMNAHTSALSLRNYARSAICVPSSTLQFDGCGQEHGLRDSAEDREWNEARHQDVDGDKDRDRGGLNLLLVPGECNFTGAKADFRKVCRLLSSLNRRYGEREHDARLRHCNHDDITVPDVFQDDYGGRGGGGGVHQETTCMTEGRKYARRDRTVSDDHMKGGAREMQRRGRWLWLLDAAKLAATSPVDLNNLPGIGAPSHSLYRADCSTDAQLAGANPKRHAPEAKRAEAEEHRIDYRPHFVVVSFYKIFGYPTGLGALLVRSDIAPLLARNKRFFGGGTLLAGAADSMFQVPKYITPRINSRVNQTPVTASASVCRISDGGSAGQEFGAGSDSMSGDHVSPEVGVLSGESIARTHVEGEEEKCVFGLASAVLQSHDNIGGSRKVVECEADVEGAAESEVTGAFSALFEDGTQHFQGIAALRHGFRLIRTLSRRSPLLPKLPKLSGDCSDAALQEKGMHALQNHAFSIFSYCLQEMRALVHTCILHAAGPGENAKQRTKTTVQEHGSAPTSTPLVTMLPLCEFYGNYVRKDLLAGNAGSRIDEDLVNPARQGPVLAFNLQWADGQKVGFSEVERKAAARHIQLRSGCFCNLGACQEALRIEAEDAELHFELGRVCGGRASSDEAGGGSEDSATDIINFRHTGAVRVSFGLGSSVEDVDIFITFLSECFLNRVSATSPLSALAHASAAAGCGSDRDVYSIQSEQKILERAASTASAVLDLSMSAADGSTSRRLSVSPSIRTPLPADRATSSVDASQKAERSDGSRLTLSSGGYIPLEVPSLCPVAPEEIHMNRSAASQSASASLTAVMPAPNGTGYAVLSAIYVYPIKSCAGMRVSEWPLSPVPHHSSESTQTSDPLSFLTLRTPPPSPPLPLLGSLLFDREWAVTDSVTQRALTQKTHPQLSLVTPLLDLDKGVLTLCAAPAAGFPRVLHLPIYTLEQHQEQMGLLQEHRGGIRSVRQQNVHGASTETGDSLVAGSLQNGVRAKDIAQLGQKIAVRVLGEARAGRSVSAEADRWFSEFILHTHQTSRTNTLPTATSESAPALASNLLAERSAQEGYRYRLLRCYTTTATINTHSSHDLASSVIGHGDRDTANGGNEAKKRQSFVNNDQFLLISTPSVAALSKMYHDHYRNSTDEASLGEESALNTPSVGIRAENFRPNLVVSPAPSAISSISAEFSAFAEDCWHKISLPLFRFRRHSAGKTYELSGAICSQVETTAGGKVSERSRGLRDSRKSEARAVLRVNGPCSRCLMVNVDQRSGSTTGKTLQTLMRVQRDRGAAAAFSAAGEVLQADVARAQASRDAIIEEGGVTEEERRPDVRVAEGGGKGMEGRGGAVVLGGTRGEDSGGLLGVTFDTLSAHSTANTAHSHGESAPESGSKQRIQAGKQRGGSSQSSSIHFGQYLCVESVHAELEAAALHNRAEVDTTNDRSAETETTRMLWVVRAGVIFKYSKSD